MARVDHTLLKPEAMEDELLRLCDEAVEFQTASVCVSPVYLSAAVRRLQGKRLPVCTVVGFPSGAVTTQAKCFETMQALEQGADEIDMVIHIGKVKMRQWDAILEEMQQIKALCASRVLKVIIEACLLTEAEKRKLCALVSESGADYIKTSTGFSSGGATYEDVALFRSALAPEVKIKAAGGIRTFACAQEMIRLGADRLGSSALVALARQAGL